MECVSEICNQYNLNKTDVVNNLNNKGIKFKMSIKHFPWNGQVNKEMCNGIKYCGGLYIQCKQKKSEGDYCSFCYKQSQQNEHGKPSAGTVDDRIAVGALDYVDPKGRKVIPFSVYMKKKNIDRETAEIEARMKEIKIEEEQFVEVVVKRGRPSKKAKEEEACKSNEGEKKKRGRPRKQKQEVSGEDILNEAMNKVEKEIVVEEHEVVIEKAEHEEDNVEHEKQDVEAEEAEEEEGIQVIEFVYKDTTYYRTTDKCPNIVYNIEQEEIGTWDEYEEQIVLG